MITLLNLIIIGLAVIGIIFISFSLYFAFGVPCTRLGKKEFELDKRIYPQYT